MADLQTEFTPKEVDANLQTIDKILNPNPSNADIYAAILALRRDTEQLREEMQPLAIFFAAIPDAIDQNPMMSMIFGKALKRK